MGNIGDLGDLSVDERLRFTMSATVF